MTIWLLPTLKIDSKIVATKANNHFCKLDRYIMFNAIYQLFF